MSGEHHSLQKVLRWERRLFYAIRSIRIQNRLILLFLLLSLLPMLITGFFSYQQSSKAIQTKIETYSMQVVNQVARNIRVEMARLENDTTEVGYSELTQNTMRNFGRLSDWQIIDAKFSMRNMLVNKFTFQSNVSNVILFSPTGKYINAYGDESYKLDLKPKLLHHLLTEIRDRNGMSVWEAVGWDDEDHLVNRLVEYENGLIIGKAIKSLFEGEYIGAVVIRTKERFFADIYRRIDIGQGSEMFILDSHGVVVSSRTPSLAFKSLYPDRMLIKHVIANHRRHRNFFSVRIKDDPYLVAFSPIENTQWYVVGAIPYAYLNAESAKIRNRIIFMGIICFILAVFLSFLFAKSISRPLNLLVNAMNQVEKGRLTVYIKDNNNDEITKVIRHFNTMVKEIENLMNDIKEKESQKRKAELKALQAQINPHFLSNVLNTAKLLANAQKAENVESLLTSLIQLLHISMGKENDLITVGREIEYLKDYLNIQEFRFYNKFQVFFEIEEEILKCKLPKFLLQPILENAIIHGVGPKKGQGIIQIKGFIYEGKIIFTITDNGVGIEHDSIGRLLSEDRVHDGKGFCGIGLKNVQERIQLYFGPEYGLRIDSSPNYFTTVEITLPILQPESSSKLDCG